MKQSIEFIKKHKKLLIEIIIILTIIIFGVSLAPKSLQNDTFYTVSIGNLIMENGIDMQDHFSWHENLPYTYPHWLYDVIISLIYNWGGWQGVYISTAIFASILGIAIYKVNKLLNKNQIISFFITIGTIYLMKGYITARAQLVTFIIFILILYWIERFLENPKKVRYSIAIILSSILVANLHVAVWPFIFVLSLPYIGEYIVSILADIIVYKKYEIWYKKAVKFIFKKNNRLQEKIKKSLEELYVLNEKVKLKRESQEPYKIKMTRNKNVKWLIVLMIICALAGFLTPLGTTPFTYLYKTMIGNTPKNINEHLPLTLINNIPILCTIVIFLAFLIFTKVKVRLSDLFMLGGLTYLMFSSRRQASIFVLICSVILNRLITQTIAIYDIKKIQKSKKGLVGVLITTLAVIVICVHGVHDIIKRKTENYVNENSYPVAAADWILENLDVNSIKLFNEYNYGSYLLYRGIPVFIDSRADLYSPEFNGEEDIFMDFINTSNIGKYYGTTFRKYGITHVIIYSNSKINMLIKNADAEKYNELYSDDNFTVYEVAF